MSHAIDLFFQAAPSFLGPGSPLQVRPRTGPRASGFPLLSLAGVRRNKIFLFPIALFIHAAIAAQVTDDFSDGNFTANPAWAGNTAHFIVNPAGQLQLNHNAAATSYLSTAFAATSLANTEWQFWVRLNFSPSNTNFARIYLTSDQANLTQPLNGYYLQLGEAGTNDAVELFRQTGNTRTSVCRARQGGIAAAFAIRIKVTRSADATWRLLVDYTGGIDFVPEASATDATHNTSAFAGWVCTYTVTNATRFFLDDVSILPPAFDTEPPQITAVEVLGSQSLRVRFNERVQPADPANFSLDNNLGNPAAATLGPDSLHIVLAWNSHFVNGATYRLTTQHVRDLAGNAMAPATHSFLYFVEVPAQAFDIRVSEIMADPTPVVQLPEAEYIELYNRSNHPFQLAGWQLHNATGHALLPAWLLQPRQFVVLTATANAARFGSAPVLGVPGFPSLNNAGDVVTLRTAAGQLIDSVSYTDTWYRSAEKKDGGWSLEIIDPENVCAEETNWTASESATGGTPGAVNSVNAGNPDLTGPRLIAFQVTASNITLHFNEKLEASPAPHIALTPAVRVQSVAFVDRTLRSLRVTVDGLLVRTLYQLTVTRLRDCAGNEIDPAHNSVSFALPETAEAGDVALNEILFNPKPNGVDFVEIVNRSEKFLNLKNWKLSNIENGIRRNVRTVSPTDFLLRPGAFLVFTESLPALLNFYPHANANALFIMRLPSFNDDSGSVALTNEADQVLDTLRYDDRWHDAILKDTEGVSLERISWDQPTQNAANWKSAPAAAGFATPGFPNANSRPEVRNEQAVRVEPEVFSPAQAPFFSSIHYAFGQSGWIANVKILDTQGRVIKTIAQNQTLAFEGFFRWDGDDDSGSPARSGYYAVWFEVFDLNGYLQTFRKRVVLMNR
jgi:hypothetical protein